MLFLFKYYAASVLLVKKVNQAVEKIKEYCKFITNFLIVWPDVWQNKGAVDNSNLSAQYGEDCVDLAGKFFLIAIECFETVKMIVGIPCCPYLLKRYIVSNIQA